MDKNNNKDIFSIGRRKTATAQVKLVEDNTDRIINSKKLEEYFNTVDTQKSAVSPLELTSTDKDYGIIAKVRGGGKKAQAHAIRHAIARSLLKINPDWRKQLKAAGMLTRDPRAKERKKYGLKRARRAPQFSR